MARWKLTEPHYLNVPTERWEHTTIDSRTGKPSRKMYRVPKHLDPRIEDDWNFRINGMDGEIHVCYEGKGLPHDIVFEGDPTPGMVPLDAEAQEITSHFNWTPTQGIDEESQRAGFYAKLGDQLIDQMTELRAAHAMAAPQVQGLDKLLEAIAAMMQQNQQLLGLLAGKKVPATTDDELARQAEALGETKVIDPEPPLEDIEPTEAEVAAAAAQQAEREAASTKRAFNRMQERRI